jgi:hypothetical protein
MHEHREDHWQVGAYRGRMNHRGQKRVWEAYLSTFGEECGAVIVQCRRSTEVQAQQRVRPLMIVCMAHAGKHRGSAGDNEPQAPDER